MANDTGDVRAAVLQVLLQLIEEDPYRSGTMMDMAEELLHQEDVGTYAQILLDKVRDDRYPSYALLSRIRTFA